MRKLLLPSLAAALVASAAPALADPFDGPFVGVQAGYNRDEVSNISGNALTDDASRDSAVLGIYGGYDYRVSDRFVLGGEAGLNFSIDDELRGGNSAAAIDINPKRAFDLSARAGYLVTDKALVYVRGGYTNVRAEVSVDDGTSTISDSSNLDGWLVGGGVDYALTESVSSRLEYRYQDLGENGGSFDRHQVLLGVSYHF